MSTSCSADPDGDGLNAWTDVLKSGREQGAKVAQGFIESPEFQSRRMDDTTYLTILYKTFLNRDPDAAGLKAWQAVLDSGFPGCMYSAALRNQRSSQKSVSVMEFSVVMRS